MAKQKKATTEVHEVEQGLTPPNKRKKKKGFLKFLIILIVIGGLLIVFKKPVNHFLAKTLKDVPIVGGLFKESGTTEVAYTYEELAEELAKSQQESAQLKTQVESLQAEKEALNKKVEDLKQYETTYDSFLKQKENWDTEIASTNTDLFISQFEQMYPETANQIYSQLKGKSLITKEQKNFSATIGQMDSDQAAKALELLISTDPELIKVALDNMGQEQKATILSSMTSEGASTVLKLISPELINE